LDLGGHRSRTAGGILDEEDAETLDAADEVELLLRGGDLVQVAPVDLECHPAEFGEMFRRGRA